MFRIIYFIVLTCLLQTGNAKQTNSKEEFIISNCMYSKIKTRVELIEQSPQYALVRMDLDPNLQQSLLKHSAACGKFLNVQPYKNKSLDDKVLLSELTKETLPLKNTAYTIAHEAEVEALYKLIEPAKIWQTNQHLTSYLNRSAKSEHGLAAAQWFKQQFDAIATEYKRTDVDSYMVKTGKNYIQPSVVTLIGKEKKGPAIVIGAHIDTYDGTMPGADDDSSGISVAMEIARVFLASELQLEHPVYIIAYAAEERGLVGSSYVVSDFINKNIPVKAVMQLDQAGYRANPEDNTVWLLKDYVDPDLTKFNAELLKKYVKIPVSYTKCGYACSDHANWFREGFKTCYPSATTLDDDNPYVHTSEDKLEILNLDHMVNFTRLGVAFVAELGLSD